MFENLVIKLNEIGYYYGEKVALQNSADLGQSISLGGYTEDGDDATAEMDYRDPGCMQTIFTCRSLR